MFWQHVKKLRVKTNNSPNQADSIPPNKWVQHFSSLFNVKESDKNKLEGSNEILPDSKYDPILDSSFTIEEISNGIRELKLRKAVPAYLSGYTGRICLRLNVYFQHIKKLLQIKKVNIYITMYK